jgi:hypothetical protein
VIDSSIFIGQVDPLVEGNELGAAATNQEKYSTVLGEVWLLCACFVGKIL